MTGLIFGRSMVNIPSDSEIPGTDAGYPVTPSDTTNLPNGRTRGIYVTVGGVVDAVFSDGATASLTLNSNTKYAIGIVQIKATGTTATGIYALY